MQYVCLVGNLGVCVNVSECMCISRNAQYTQKLTTGTISSTVTSSDSRRKSGGSCLAGSLGVSLCEVSQPETENVRYHLKQGKNFLVGSL